MSFIQSSLDSSTRSVSLKIIKERNELLKVIYSSDANKYRKSVTKVGRKFIIDYETGIGEFLHY